MGRVKVYEIAEERIDPIECTRVFDVVSVQEPDPELDRNGCALGSGGGDIMQGSIPWLHMSPATWVMVRYFDVELTLGDAAAGVQAGSLPPA